jgi:hypothetical protein
LGVRQKSDDAKISPLTVKSTAIGTAFPERRYHDSGKNKALTNKFIQLSVI